MGQAVSSGRPGGEGDGRGRNETGLGTLVVFGAEMAGAAF